MKQNKLVTQVYQACLANDTEKVAELRKKEFVKIVKHKAAGKSFTTKWIVITV
jgi:hypothetical protein